MYIHIMRSNSHEPFKSLAKHSGPPPDCMTATWSQCRQTYVSLIPTSSHLLDFFCSFPHKTTSVITTLVRALRSHKSLSRMKEPIPTVRTSIDMISQISWPLSYPFHSWMICSSVLMLMIIITIHPEEATMWSHLSIRCTPFYLILDRTIKQVFLFPSILFQWQRLLLDETCSINEACQTP